VEKISRDELEENWDEDFDGNFVCYESQALRDWYFYAGYSAEEDPRTIRGVKNGHLCIFTTVEPNMPESSRIVVAMFIIEKIFEGDDEDCGFVGTGEDAEYILEFSPNEARKMKFWEVYQNPNAPDRIQWGSGLFRYFSDEDAIKFLEMAVEVKRGTSNEKVAEDFLNYYRELNRV